MRKRKGEWDEEFSAPRRKMGSDQTLGASCFETYGNVVDLDRRVRRNIRKKT